MKKVWIPIGLGLSGIIVYGLMSQFGRRERSEARVEQRPATLDSTAKRTREKSTEKSNSDQNWTPQLDQQEAQKLVEKMAGTLQKVRERHADLLQTAKATVQINQQLKELNGKMQKNLTPDVLIMMRNNTLAPEVQEALSAINEEELNLVENYRSQFINHVRNIK